MTTLKFVSNLLKFKGFRAVDVCFEGCGQEAAIMVSVEPHNNGCRCPQCGRRGKIVRVMEPRRWRDVRGVGLPAIPPPRAPPEPRFAFALQG